MVTSTKEQTITVGLGEACVTKDPSVSLACFGLGSCIGLCTYDPVAKVAGMAHIVLPESNHGGQGKALARYADVAVPLLVEEMRKHGAVKSRLVVKIVGAARMITAVRYDATLEMGARNLEMTKKALDSEGINLAAADVGGTKGRSVWLSVDTGRVMVRTAGAEFSELR